MLWDRLRARSTTSHLPVALVDVRFVIARTALSAALACIIVFVFAALNVTYAAEIHRVVYVIPLEIVTAIVLGFCLCGLPDVAAALRLVHASAPDARVRGDRPAERNILIRALACAERTGNPSLIATVRAHAAFGAWFAAEDEEFQNHAHALDQIVGEEPMRGLRRFAMSTRGVVQDVSDPSELPEWTARTHLVACADCDDSSDAKRHAARAAEAADSSGDAFLQVVTTIALAELDGAQRECLYDKAFECCNAVVAPQLSEAVLALAAGKPDAGALSPFVNRRLRAARSSRPMLDVRFADGSVRIDGNPIKLRPRETALLFVVAENDSGASFDELSDQLWPDVDGDAARNALHVCLHRLRKALGDDAAIARSVSRYRLSDDASVDLWQLQRLLKNVACKEFLDDEDRKQLSEAFDALQAGRRERPAEQQWFLRIERTIVRLTCDAGHRLAEDALKRGDLETHEKYRNLIAELSLDEGDKKDLSGI